jgi:cephalosporin hydroxylase
MIDHEPTTTFPTDDAASAAEALAEGRPDDARELLRSALAGQIDLEDLNDLAVICHATGRSDAAQALLRAALVIGGDDPVLARNLAAIEVAQETQAPPASPAADPWRDALPPTVAARPHAPLLDYWRERLAQHTRDSYLGVPLSKFPEDLRVYEHLLGVQCPDVVVELGSQFGASTLWFRDRLRTLAAYGRVSEPRVVCVDIDVSHIRANLERVDPGHGPSITVIEGDVTDPAVRAAVGREIPAGANVMVIEDSAHVEATTRAALELYADLVPVGGFFVVEDGCIDVEDLRIDPHWPRGVLPALHVWLTTAQGQGFRVRRDLEMYGVTCHPAGFLQRVA